MKVVSGNLRDSLPVNLRDEAFETLIEAGGARVERIVSRGHVSPADGWYDQDNHEFVVVFSGAATVRLEDAREFELSPGDYLGIPAHVRHRVAWTNPAVETVWLAFHFPP